MYTSALKIFSITIWPLWPSLLTPTWTKCYTIYQHEIITGTQTKLQEHLRTHVSNEGAHILYRPFYCPSVACKCLETIDSISLPHRSLNTDPATGAQAIFLGLFGFLKCVCLMHTAPYATYIIEVQETEAATQDLHCWMGQMFWVGGRKFMKSEYLTHHTKRTMFLLFSNEFGPYQWWGRRQINLILW